MREKLIELFNNAIEHSNDVCIYYDTCEDCPGRKYGNMCRDYLSADYLIANGVTVQELDGCAYCKEDADGYRLAFGAFSLRNPFHNGEWEIRTGHCDPSRIYFCPMCGRRLPQPPKGE